MKKIIYPTAEKTIEYNLLALSILKVKKADKAEVLSYQKLADCIEGCKNFGGAFMTKQCFC